MLPCASINTVNKIAAEIPSLDPYEHPIIHKFSAVYPLILMLVFQDVLLFRPFTHVI